MVFLPTMTMQLLKSAPFRAMVSYATAPKGRRLLFLPLHKKKAAEYAAATPWRKSGLTPPFRDFHGALAPTARAGSHAGNPLERKAFCGFDAHPPGGLLLSLRDNSPCAAKSDESRRGAKPSAASGGRSEAEAQ